MFSISPSYRKELKKKFEAKSGLFFNFFFFDNAKSHEHRNEFTWPPGMEEAKRRESERKKNIHVLI